MAYEREDISAFCKRKGFVFPSSSIYGGLAGVYDYGPLGVLLRDNIRDEWLRFYLKNWDNIYQIDSAIFMSPEVWKASGHVGGFSDPLVEYKKTNERFRVDHLLEDVGVTADEKMSEEELQKLFDDNFDKLKLPSKKREDFTKVMKFNLMVSSNLGETVSGDKEPVYLRPETAQGMYVNFKNVVSSGTMKVPFGLMQVGKAFRNEIKPQQFLFRLREFTQMEMQYFVHEDDADATYEEMKEKRMSFYTDCLGVSRDRLRFKDHENLVFYAKNACDIEYDFGDGDWREIEGIHHRGDYDLSQHKKHSGEDMSYVDPNGGGKYIPNVIEASCGLDRLFYMVLSENLREEGVSGGDKRVVLGVPVGLAPYKVAVSPLLKNKDELKAKAKEIYDMLRRKYLNVVWDDNGNIGKRYRRQDEVGTPFCVVVDFDSLERGDVSVRYRDTMEQERVAMDELIAFFDSKLG